MKTALASLTSTLYSTGTHMVADLFTLVLSGTTFRWTSADADVSVGTGGTNYVNYSEPLYPSQFNYTAGGAKTAANMTDLGLSNGVTVASSTVQNGAYVSHPAYPSTPVTVCVSAYVKMDDLSTPRLDPGGGGSSYDFVLAETGNWATINPTVTLVGSNVYRVSAAYYVANGAILADCGFFRLSSHSGKGFTVTGFQSNSGTSPTTYVKTTGSAITASAGITYSATSSPYLARVSSRAVQGVEVSTLDLSIGGNFAINGTSASLLAAKGRFDNAPLRVDRAYMTGTWGSAPNGVVNLFSGSIVEVTPGATLIKAVAKSALTRLNEELPRRYFQPQCPFMVYDGQCGLSSASFRDSRTGLTGSTYTMISSSATSRAYPGSRVTFYSGSMSGSSFTIVSTGSSTRFNVFPKMSSPPGTGNDAFYVYSGCDKSRDTCALTFSNLARFGGFPDAPPEDFTMERNWPTREQDFGYYDPRTGKWRNAP